MATHSASSQGADDVGLLDRLVIVKVLVVLVIAVLLVVKLILVLLLVLLHGIAVGGLALLGSQLEALLLVELKLLLRVILLVIDVDVAVNLRVAVLAKVGREGVVRDLDDGSSVGGSQLLAKGGVGDGEVVSDVNRDLLTWMLACAGELARYDLPGTRVRDQRFIFVDISYIQVVVDGNGRKTSVGERVLYVLVAKSTFNRHARQRTSTKNLIPLMLIATWGLSRHPTTRGHPAF